MGSYGNLYRMNSVDDKGQDWLSNMGLFHWSNSLSTWLFSNRFEML